MQLDQETERYLLEPSAALRNAIKYALMEQNSNLKDWGRKNPGHGTERGTPAWLGQTLVGTANGPKATALREKIINDAGRERVLELMWLRLPAALKGNYPKGDQK